MPAFRNVRRSRRISRQPPRDPGEWPAPTDPPPFWVARIDPPCFGTGSDECDLFHLNLLYPDVDDSESTSSGASASSPAPAPPSTFNSAEPDVEADLSSPLLSPVLLFSGGARTSHSRKKKEGHIPRPPNAFMIFRSELWRKEKVKRTVERDHRNISRIAGALWNRLSTTDQVPYRRAAEEAKRIHAQLYPDYKYAPVYHRDRRAQPKAKADHKKKAQRCDKVAQLLHRGIVGDELEKELGKRKAGKVDGYASDESEYVDAPPRKKSRKSSKASTKKSSSTQRPNRARAVQAQPEEPTSSAVVADAQEDCVVGALAYPSASPSPRASNSSECAPTTPDMGAFVPTSEIPDICIGEPQVRSFSTLAIKLCADVRL